MLFVLVHAADVQDRDGAPALLQAIRHRFPWLRHIFTDGGYAGGKLRDALKGQGDWTIEIIKRSDTAKGFEVLPRFKSGTKRSPKARLQPPEIFLRPVAGSATNQRNKARS